MKTFALFCFLLLASACILAVRADGEDTVVDAPKMEEQPKIAADEEQQEDEEEVDNETEEDEQYEEKEMDDGQRGKRGLGIPGTCHWRRYRYSFCWVCCYRPICRPCRRRICRRGYQCSYICRKIRCYRCRSRG